MTMYVIMYTVCLVGAKVCIDLPPYPILYETKKECDRAAEINHLQAASAFERLIQNYNEENKENQIVIEDTDTLAVGAVCKLREQKI